MLIKKKKAGVLLLGSVLVTLPSYAQSNAQLVVTRVNFAADDGEEPIAQFLQRLYNYAKSQPYGSHPIYESIHTFRNSFTERYPFLVAPGGVVRTRMPRSELRERLRQPDGSLGVILTHQALPESPARRAAQPTPPAPPATQPLAAPREAVVGDTTRLLGRITALEQRLGGDSTRLLGRITALEQRLVAVAEGTTAGSELARELSLALRDLEVKVNNAPTATQLLALARNFELLAQRVGTIDGRVESLERGVTTLTQEVGRHVGVGSWLFVLVAVAITFILIALGWGRLRLGELAKRVTAIEESDIRQKVERTTADLAAEVAEARARRAGAAAPPPADGRMAA